jgi:DHA2 family multidrug resistance protein
LTLDRGELKDWFDSPEIVIEALAAAVAFYMFVVHTFTHPKPFLSPALFTDRNFVTATVFIFLIGVILFATLALIPPLMQHLLHYPVVTTGFLTAPRGAGAMAAMMLVGRLSGKVDARVIMTAGLSLTAFSLWIMTHFSLLMDSTPILVTGVIQGLGIGLSYVPLSTLAFATLPQVLRNEGTAFFSLLRNIGSAIGISVVQFLLTRNTQIMHAHMAEHVTPYDTGNWAYQALHASPATPPGLAALNGLVTREAAMIAYLDDFKLMMVITVVVIPLLFLLRRPPGAKKAAPEEAAVMEKTT